MYVWGIERLGKWGGGMSECNGESGELSEGMLCRYNGAFHHSHLQWKLFLRVSPTHCGAHIDMNDEDAQCVKLTHSPVPLR